MSHFIKTGYWEKSAKKYKDWLDLERLIAGISPSIPSATSSIAGITKLYTNISGSNTDGAVSQNTIRLSIPYVTPEQYGAVGDGVTNDVVAIQAAIDSGFPVYFSKKNYRVNSQLNVPQDAILFGSGYASIISTTSNINIINVTGTNVTIDTLTFVGNNSGGAQVGIRQAGVLFTTLLYGLRVNNCNFINLNFAGIHSTNTPGTASTHEGAIRGDNNFFTGCGTGLLIGDRTEYCVFTRTKAVTCGVGIYNIGGNNQYLGGSLTTCTSHGFRADTGANDGKFSVVGFSINHNAVGVLCFGLLNGCIFDSCSILASTTNPINIATSTGVFFNNCDISGSGNITLTGNIYPYGFKNCRWVQTPAFNLVSGAAAISDGCSPGVTSPSALSANTNDYAPSGIANTNILRISATSPFDLTGIAMGGTMSPERKLTLVNIGANTITLKNDVTSTAANRFLLNADFALAANMQCSLEYDGTSLRWRKSY